MWRPVSTTLPNPAPAEPGGGLSESASPNRTRRAVGETSGVTWWKSVGGGGGGGGQEGVTEKEGGGRKWRKETERRRRSTVGKRRIL